MHPLLTTIGLIEIIKSTMHLQRRNPIVFVPGLFGSMGDEIIPGTGDWGFGMATPVYEPFVQQLEHWGYQKDRNLFIAFYDWRKACTECAENYLMKTIELARTKSKSRKVNLICHSMGGLVARAYMQGKNYRGDVEHLIIIGTPHAGAVNAYFFWAGGKLPYNRNLKSDIFKTLLEGYLWILEKYYGEKNDMDTIHHHLKGARDLLPSRQYGNYLYYLDREGAMNFISYQQMHYKNDFLDDLNENQKRRMPRNVKVTLIAGKGIETNHCLQIDPKRQPDGQRWLDGRVVDVAKSLEGDGTVMVKSVMALEGDRYILHGSHEEILEKCGFVLRKKLGIEDEPLMRKRAEVLKNHVSILVKGVGEISLKALGSEGELTLYDGTEKAEGLYVEKYGNGLTWIIVTNCQYDHLIFHFLSKENHTLDVLVKDKGGNVKRVQSKEVSAGQRYRIHMD
ncbi:esterase/lipase family protein [Thermotalea metallivorans]|uniref:Lecithin:cholesterol acyltransferase n=1 Tax=Thermotalea metallivorans TaxID=520762 RepID=A0A140LEF3_9FIRM|nr:alpha/beta hydrolase [Thermotalea metallivorans]KXG78928.1 hypothetical protein AN619_00870 [Thermotalea metallivorans]